MSRFHPIDYGRAIKTVRTLRGITQRELGTVSGTTGSYISFIESSEKRPSADMLESIAVGLRVPVWLLVMLGSHPDDLGPKIAKLVPKILTDYLGSTSIAES
jgi:transcriptional regulator with XRE-family HTH domain